MSCTHLDKTLTDHVVEGRDNLVDSDGVVAHTQNTVELGSYEGHARLGQGLGECLILYVNSTKGDDVC